MSSNAIFAFVAYALVWVGLFGYLLLLGRREADLRIELNELKRRLTAKPGGDR